MRSAGKWEDLAPRLISGVAVAVVGLSLIWAGGLGTLALAVAITGLMIWELASLTAQGRPRQAVLLGLLAAASLAAVVLWHRPLGLALLVLAPAIGALLPRRDRAVFFVYGLAILLAGYGIAGFRAGHGLGFVLWFVLLVIMTDLLGYFGGRLIGGPKFWPRVSPKKTWSGTVAGWIGAALTAAGFVALGLAPVWIIAFSVLVSFASQLGDIAESAIKRRAGVKDSSHILPGHGGVLDRFDGLIGAVIFLMVWGAFLPVPGVGD